MSCPPTTTALHANTNQIGAKTAPASHRPTACWRPATHNPRPHTATIASPSRHRVKAGQRCRFTPIHPVRPYRVSRRDWPVPGLHVRLRTSKLINDLASQTCHQNKIITCKVRSCCHTAGRASCLLGFTHERPYMYTQTSSTRHQKSQASGSSSSRQQHQAAASGSSSSRQQHQAAASGSSTRQQQEAAAPGSSTRQQQQAAAAGRGQQRPPHRASRHTGPMKQPQQLLRQPRLALDVLAAHGDLHAPTATPDRAPTGSRPPQSRRRSRSRRLTRPRTGTLAAALVLPTPPCQLVRPCRLAAAVTARAA